MATCPLGHELISTCYASFSLKCDHEGCGRTIRRGESHLRCEVCDYDLCNIAHDLATPVRQTRGGTPCSSTSEQALPAPTPPPPTLEERFALLEAENAKLRTQLKSARASGPRSSQAKQPEDEEAASPAGELDRLSYRRVREACVQWIEPTLQKREGLRADILNYLVLTSPIEERRRFSTLQVAAQERYLGIESAVRTMREQGYTAVHSADLVVNEHLSIGTIRNINDRLTKKKNERGVAEKIVLARPPTYLPDPEAETVNSLTRDMNRALGIGRALITCPQPFRRDQEIHTEMYATFKDRTLHLTVPTVDGYEGAGFDIVHSARDVLRQAAADNNLRALPPGRMRRLQVVFDKLRWSNGKSMTRWNIRTPDTVRDHNSTRYGRDLLTYEGDDNLTWLTKSVLSPRFTS